MDVGLVCDSCSAFNPMGVKICAHCEAPISLDDPDASKPSFDDGETTLGIAPGPPGRVPCPACGAEVVAGHRFCGHCGYRMPERSAAVHSRTTAARGPSNQRGAQRTGKRSTQYFSAMQTARAKLVVIRGDGMDGVSFTLAGQEHLVGRQNTPILFEDDVFISPIHANFYYELGNLMVRDEQSTNGVYIRISGSVELNPGDRFLVGEQLLEFRTMPQMNSPMATDDGTYFFASPIRETYFYVVQSLLGGAYGLTYRASKPEINIGREGNDIDFPNDLFISGHHAKLSFTHENKLILVDMDSKNGTFLRINGEQMLRHGDYVFMGQQLLRVEIV